MTTRAPMNQRLKKRLIETNKIHIISLKLKIKKEGSKKTSSKNKHINSTKQHVKPVSVDQWNKMTVTFLTLGMLASIP